MQPPTTTHNHPQSPTIIHNLQQPPKTIHNHPQPPTTICNHPQPPITIYNDPQRPTTIRNHPQPSTTTHNHPQLSTISHNHPQPSTFIHDHKKDNKKDEKELFLIFAVKVFSFALLNTEAIACFLTLYKIKQWEKLFKITVLQLLLKSYTKILMESLTFFIYLTAFY